MSPRGMLSDYWYAFQQELFPRPESEPGPMGERYELFVTVLELVRVEARLPYIRGLVGRPAEDRCSTFRLCGWSGVGRLPGEAAFSRALASSPRADWPAGCMRR